MIECTVDSTTLIDVLRGTYNFGPLLARYSGIGLSHVALGEILLGIHKSSHPRELSKTLTVIKGMTLLHGGERTAVLYAEIRHDLERRGIMIPHNDIWIAAASIQADVPLISRDQHFLRIRSLKTIPY